MTYRASALSLSRNRCSPCASLCERDTTAAACLPVSAVTSWDTGQRSRERQSQQGVTLLGTPTSSATLRDRVEGALVESVGADSVFIFSMQSLSGHSPTSTVDCFQVRRTPGSTGVALPHLNTAVTTGAPPFGATSRPGGRSCHRDGILLLTVRNQRQTQAHPHTGNRFTVSHRQLPAMVQGDTLCDVKPDTKMWDTISTGTMRLHTHKQRL